MILVNTETIKGYEITEVIGLVRGNTIRAKHVGKDIMANLKQLVGGELKGYTEMMTEARDEAVGRMVAEAQQFNADAIVNVRFATSAVMQAASEVLVYGTAVKLQKV